MAGADGVGYVDCGDDVPVVPLTADGHVLMAAERSHAFDREALRLAGGEVGGDKPLEQAASCELQGGLGRQAARTDFPGTLQPFTYLHSRRFAFLARNLVPARLEGDEVYLVRARRLSLDTFDELCRSGELQDGPAIAALCLAREAGQRQIMARAIHDNCRGQQAGRRHSQDPFLAAWDGLQ